MAFIQWLGHASFMINTKEKIIYIDPSEGEYHQKANLILITHSHQDHCNTLKIDKILRDDTIIFAPINCGSKTWKNTRNLKPGEKAIVGEIIVEAMEAYNYKRFRSPGVFYHPRGFGVGYILTVEGKTIYHAGDTDFIPEMRQLQVRNIDLALLPSGGTFTMDNPEALEAILAIHPKTVILMHNWDTNPKEVKKALETKSPIKIVILQPGEQVTL